MTDLAGRDPAGWRPQRRRLIVALLALAALAACGKKGTLRLPRPGETSDDEQKDQG